MLLVIFWSNWGRRVKAQGVAVHLPTTNLRDEAHNCTEGCFKMLLIGGSLLIPYKQNASGTVWSGPVAKDPGQKEWAPSQPAFSRRPACKDAGQIGRTLPASDTLSSAMGVEEGGQRGFWEPPAIVLASSRLHASPCDCATFVLK